MEKRHLDRRLAQMEAEGVKFRTGIEIGKDVCADDLRRRYDAVLFAVGLDHRAGPAGARPGPGRASTRRWSTCRWPTGCRRVTSTELADPRPRQARRHHRRWRHRCGLPGHRDPAGRCQHHAAGDPADAAAGPAGRPALADVPDGLPGVVGSRGGRRAGVLGVDEALPGTRGPGDRAGTRRCRVDRRPSGRGRRQPSGSSPRTWSRSRWASSGRRRRPSFEQIGLRPRRPRQLRARATTTPRAPRGVRGRRRRTWPVADRVGDRGGRRPLRRRAPGGTTNLPKPLPASTLTGDRLNGQRIRHRCHRVLGERPGCAELADHSLGLRSVRRAKIVCTLGPATDVRRSSQNSSTRGCRLRV